MNKKEKEVLDTWTQYVEAVEWRKKAEVEMKAHKETEEVLKKKLCALVGDGEEVAGVRHYTTIKPSVSYGKLYVALVRELVPKTKRAKVEELRNQFTVFWTVHNVKAV